MIWPNYKTQTFLLVTALVLACAPALVPASAPVPTFDPNSLNTSIVQTADAAATQTALVASPASATFTPRPTSTPSETPSPTVTFVFILSTPTVPTPAPEPGSSGLEFDCQIVSRSPADGAHLGQKTDFSMVWQVRNVGTEVWNADNADYRYKSGDKLHKASIYDLESSVPSGGQTEIKVAMKTPGSAGSYSTTWVITSGSTEFCRMTITILVP